MSVVHVDMHLPLQAYITLSDFVSGNLLQEGSAPGVMRAQVLEPQTRAALPMARVQDQVSVLWQTLPEAQAQVP